MFILQIPIGQDPNNVMPRITPPNTSGGPTVGTNPTMPRSPISDPWQPTLDHIRQTHAAELRGLIRNQTIVGRTMRAVLAGGNNNIQLIYNEDGSYTRPNDTGKYYYQADGSIFYSGGNITLPSGQVTTRAPQTLRNPTNSTSTWDESTVGRTPLTGTFALNKLDLVPDGSGAFTLPGEGNSGRYFIQADGSIFYEGGTRNGSNTLAQTYANGSWDTTRNTAAAGTLTAARCGFIPLQNGRYLHPPSGSEFEFTNEQLAQLESIGLTANQYGCFSIQGDSRYYFILPDGRVYTPGGGTNSQNPLPGRTFHNGTWTEDRSTLSGSANRIAYHGLIPRPDGTFRNPADTQILYIPNADGSMTVIDPRWFQGDRNRWGPMTLSQNRWTFNHYFLSAEHYIIGYSMTQNADGSLTRPGVQGRYYRLSGDRLLYIRPSDNTQWIFHNGRWTQSSTPVEIPNPPIPPRRITIQPSDPSLTPPRTTTTTSTTTTTTTTTSSSSTSSVNPNDWRRLGIDPNTLRPIPGHYMNRQP